MLTCAECLREAFIHDTPSSGAAPAITVHSGWALCGLHLVEILESQQQAKERAATTIVKTTAQ